MEILIRLAREEDYERAENIMQQVQNLHVSLRPDQYKKVPTALPRAEFDELRKKGWFLVAEADGKVVGITSVLVRHVETPHQITRDVLYIEAMAVDENYRKNKIARAFFERLKEWKRQEGFSSIELQVNAKNEVAKTAYKKCGFVEKSINMELVER